jgi:hypothetical protein
MTEPVLPLQTILFQVLFLFVAIALEARVFHRRLRLTRKHSVQYATSINLLTAVIGWVVFFIVQDVLPPDLKSQLIGYIFFDRLFTPRPPGLNLTIAMAGIGMFFAAFVIKLKGLELLDAIVRTSNEWQTSPLSSDNRQSGLAVRLRRAALQTNPNNAMVVLLANAYSHSAILLLLFLRFLQFNSFGREIL